MLISSIIDVLFVSVIVYVLLVWFKKTRAAFVLIGFLIVSVFYLLAEQFNLVLTSTIFQSFFTVIAIALVIVFQQEIRYFFEQIAVWGLKKRFKRNKLQKPFTREVNVIAKSAFDLGEQKIGALIVIQGKNRILSHVDGGIDLDGRISEPLFKSLFDPHSIGHDGAVLIENDRITHFSCHLPLSKNLEKLGPGGTRHAAALGLSEESDALCLVVSEERGTVSLVCNGDIQVIASPQELVPLLQQFFEENYLKKEKSFWHSLYKKNYKEKILAISIATLFWFVLGYGSELVYKTYSVPVQWVQLADELKVSHLEPNKVNISLSAPRRYFYLMRKGKIKINLNASAWKVGKRAIRVSDSSLSFPPGADLKNVFPREVTVLTEPNQ